MAFHLHEARKTVQGPILRLVGAAHAVRVAELLAGTRRHRPWRASAGHGSSSAISTPRASPRSCPIRRCRTPCGRTLRSGQLPEGTELFATVAPKLEASFGPLTVIAGGRSETSGERQHQVASYAAHHGEPAHSGRWTGGRPRRPAGGGLAGRHRLPPGTDANRNHTLAAPDLLRFRPPLRPGPGTSGARSLRDGGRRPRCRRRQPGVGDLRRRPMLPVAGTDRRDRDRPNRRRGARSRDPEGEVPPSFHENQAATPGGPGSPPPVPGRSGRLAPCLFGRGHLFLSHRKTSWWRTGAATSNRGRCAVLSAESSHSEPFTTSMLDGIDLRETLLRRHEGRIWVRERGRQPGVAGAVVMIFDEDPSGIRLPLSDVVARRARAGIATWLSTPPIRCTRWSGPASCARPTADSCSATRRAGSSTSGAIPDYEAARTKPEVLLMAAVDYSTDSIVVHVGRHPPSDADPRVRLTEGEADCPPPAREPLAFQRQQGPRGPHPRRPRQAGDREGLPVVTTPKGFQFSIMNFEF